MTGFQKAVKYLAVAFGIFLAISIISLILSTSLGVLNMFGFISSGSGDKVINESFMDITKLDIDNGAGEIEIKTGDSVKVEAYNVNDKFICRSRGGTLEIKSDYDGFHLFGFGSWNSKTPKIFIYLPEDFNAESVRLETGAGKVRIERLSADSLEIKIGAGEFKADNITSLSKTKIKGGVGSTQFRNTRLNNVDLDAGVGEVNIDGIITGDSKIKCGVGSVDIDISAPRSDYNLDVKTGIGQIKVNGEKYSDDTKDPDSGAENKLKLEGGIGEVIVDFKD